MIPKCPLNIAIERTYFLDEDFIDKSLRRESGNGNGIPALLYGTGMDPARP